MSTCVAKRTMSGDGAACLYGTTPQHQRGAIGLVLMVMIGLLIGLLVIGYAHNVRGNDVVDPRTILALAKAREALLGYAATYRDTHPAESFGYFPCPDMGTGTEGQAASACGGTDITVIGRLPWKTLDLPPLRDTTLYEGLPAGRDPPGGQWRSVHHRQLHRLRQLRNQLPLRRHQAQLPGAEETGAVVLAAVRRGTGAG